MANRINSGNGKLIGAAVIGALVGVGIGMLFAPDKGSVTRSKLMKKGKKMSGKLKKELYSPIDVLSKNTKRPPLI